ncbi:MAG: hypothetical protein UR28_C0008G0009 [Candidatus Peregrinibacteria bacterium GW2011_GWF2_33_10]|nr:MAG: hypothetical protein UR28_C0008G0009 [Candidatus Peregrinibacteria bacterium GW2011_GWF2_33_10]OGJ45212.1 MAG: hypothetical protein A2263_06600 [Candidatus Peregrinibacteria bacterium RIFOXYA2_FULL_33_21]OGJ46464.1 MAG: hypothetical protein A2272_00290 [Candidatus Peregrinibacteria bacterium RIFOXYA12_FULL_33_12]OGJ51136.1 MAG: hypothetical protein A2307_04685 [Candidatus Peregrinibacteria bacterium RIFOXYB2_FULL_33_20]
MEGEGHLRLVGISAEKPTITKLIKILSSLNLENYGDSQTTDQQDFITGTIEVSSKFFIANPQEYIYVERLDYPSHHDQLIMNITDMLSFYDITEAEESLKLVTILFGLSRNNIWQFLEASLKRYQQKILIINCETRKFLFVDPAIFNKVKTRKINLMSATVRKLITAVSLSD